MPLHCQAAFTLYIPVYLHYLYVIGSFCRTTGRTVVVPGWQPCALDLVFLCPALLCVIPHACPCSTCPWLVVLVIYCIVCVLLTVDRDWGTDRTDRDRDWTGQELFLYWPPCPVNPLPLVCLVTTLYCRPCDLPPCLWTVNPSYCVLPHCPS